LSLRARAIGALVAGAAVVAACSGGSDTTTVDVQLTDYEITANQASVPAGDTTFAVRNDGRIAHELAVVRTDVEPGALPRHPDGTADEDADGVEVLDRIQLGAGAAGDLELDLAPGGYALVCNLPPDATQNTPAHYERRMYAAFSVTG
jgi:uncharacterized cupredoxin-like copper-binding protein